MNEPIETVIVRGQQKFDLHDILNPIETEINNDRIISILKNQKYTYYKLMPIRNLFPSSVVNDTKQTFVRFCGGFWQGCMGPTKFVAPAPHSIIQSPSCPLPLDCSPHTGVEFSSTKSALGRLTSGAA